jgi:hypothetical protein
MARQLKTFTMMYCGGEGQVEKRGRERVARDQLTPLIRSGGERGESKQSINVLFPSALMICTVYSVHADLSVSYLRSAVEASLDIKKVQMEPNNHYLYKLC